MNIESNQPAIVIVPISIGELIDKITILQIKRIKMNKKQLSNVNRELQYLEQVLKDKKLIIDEFLFNQLKEINNSIWEVEDRIRLKESLQQFDKEFIDLARSVYKKNDYRASIKRKINDRYCSEVIEEKSYAKY